mgnify:CR=1 FL=1
MRIYKFKDMKLGWFIGNFEPTAYYSKEFEVGYKTHFKDESWPKHYQEIATEINFLIDGKMAIDSKLLYPGDIFVIEPHEIIKPRFITDCRLVVVKVPSIPMDKIVVPDETKEGVYENDYDRSHDQSQEKSRELGETKKGSLPTSTEAEERLWP